MEGKVWLDEIPKKCEMCSTKIKDEFYYGTIYGTGCWAIFCKSCAETYEDLPSYKYVKKGRKFYLSKS
jgi:hypothetical protein